MTDGNPLYRGGNDVADSDCLIFVFEKSGLNEFYTLEIDGGRAYKEVLTPTANDISNSFFHVQVNDANSTYFANSGSDGTMRTMALSAGTHNYTVTGSVSGVVLSGSIDIAKKGSNGGSDVLPAPTLSADGTESGDAQIKKLADGAYVMPTGHGLNDVHGGETNNRIFKFTTQTAEKAILKIMASDGHVVYTEEVPGGTETFAAGPHYFYVQVTGEDLGNAGTGTMQNTALIPGTYTYTVHGSVSGLLLHGSMVITTSAS